MGKHSTGTGKQLTKVVYKPDTQSTEEYIIIVNPDEFEKWKNGDTTIPLAEVVDSFDIFFSGQGNQGLLGKASNQQLDNVFGTHKDVDVVEQILSKGNGQPGEAITNATFNSTNVGKGSIGLDTRGKGLSGV